jgi:hypothetical protein
VRRDAYDGAAKFSDYVLRRWLEDLEGKEGGFTGDQRAYQVAVAPVKAIVAVAQKGKPHVMKVTPPGGDDTGVELKVGRCTSRIQLSRCCIAESLCSSTPPTV